MAILILTEAGSTRRFNLRPGRLSFGSGADVTLKLASGDVAERHGEIEMGDGGAVLRCAKGVMPAMVGGKPASSDHVFREGQSVKIGGATLSVEYGEGEGPPAAASPVVRTRSASGSRPRRRPSNDEDDDGARRGRHRIERKSDPTGIIIGVGVALVLVVVGYMFVNKAAKGLAGEEFVFSTAYNRAERDMEENAIAARQAFRTLLTKNITPSERSKVEARIAELDERLVQVDETVRNTRGDDYARIRLRAFADKFEVTENRPYARVFVKRSKWFMGEYPTHDENAWILRMLELVNPVAELGELPTIADLEAEVKSEVDKAPKDFIEAEKAIARFLETASDSGDLASAQRLRAETQTKEREHYEQMIANAMASGDKVKYPTNYNAGLAMNDLILIMVNCNDAELREDGAFRLLKFEEFTREFVEKHYKNDRKHFWMRMIQVPTLRAWAVKNGLI